MADHTPGPWEMRSDGCVRTSGSNEFAFIRIASPWVESAFSAEDDDEVAANMRLIAAAPEMLQWLCALVVLVGSDDRYENSECAREARAAIAKATGQ